MKPEEDEREKIEYNTLLKNVSEVLKTHAGREFIWCILDQCDIYGAQFTGNSTTFFNEGKRSIGVFLLEIMGEAEPLAYANLLKEKILEQQGAKNGK